jgi:hypothetical protein
MAILDFSGLPLLSQAVICVEGADNENTNIGKFGLVDVRSLFPSLLARGSSECHHASGFVPDMRAFSLSDSTCPCQAADR